MELTIDIIAREQSNSNHVFISFLGANAWIAYGQSAINLHLLLPNISYRKQPNKEGIEVMIVDQSSLDWLLKKLPPESQTPEMITLCMPDGIF